MARNTRDGGRFVAALDRYTKLVREARDNGRIVRRRGASGELPFELVCHITYQVYSRIVAPQVESLQNYKAFSNFVYGEINPPLMREIIREARITHDSVFVDLGCGIGNAVLHVAAQTGCEAYGVEIMQTPARLAELQLREFQSRMRGYGFANSTIRILHGDFLELEQVAQLLKRADVLLVNNYAFDAQLNQRLLQLFLDLKEGTRIISLRNFVPLDHKITVRNAGSAESILRITSHAYPSGSVSWTNSGGQYFIQTVDRTAVQQFWRDMERARPTNPVH
ncbi:histone-lysine N-methyltransferase [Syncephalis pseudoplumigaleata]|uniref:Histone-lysine N-methyltransferase, H3 lysine-79 specific n=1 Tax=Syncephalis pseudoplumigaleata TaxID=1712513 RepID=A0A4P9YTT4_9FUNG|nr:histone-lysine N-methyltransferase [Syncephalis pseudoplumigaleata]|eukprot:RKP23195.1 histone-lysine N-methyltransferase [Syncephalis pseudoplumigaleata]